MRVGILIAALAFLLYDFAGHRKPARAASATVNYSALDPTASAPTSSTTATSPRVEFESDIKPILQSKCMPCHFSGGQMYDHLPFDRPETVRKLGEKLFTRIKDEEQRQLIRKFLQQ